MTFIIMVTVITTWLWLRQSFECFKQNKKQTYIHTLYASLASVNFFVLTGGRYSYYTAAAISPEGLPSVLSL